MSKSYERYVERRAVWQECLDSQDRHSIWRQIWLGAWNIAAYRTVMRAVELAPPAEGGGAQLNGTILNLFHDAVFEGECLRVRRLTEVSSDGLESREYAVYSLGTLLKDMEDHAKLITLKNVRQAELDKGSDAWWVEERTRDTQQLLRYGNAEHAHVPAKLFNDMRRALEGSSVRVKTYADKYLAHCASPDSRASADTGGPSFAEILQAMRLIAETADFLSVHILNGGSHGVLPIPQHDQLAYLDRSLSPDDETLQQLYERWRETQDELEGWTVSIDTMLGRLQDGG